MAERKISPYVVSAMCGCWARESGMNPGIWESLTPVPWTAVWGEYGDNTGGFGLGQWTNTNGDHKGRLYQLHKWVNENGYKDGELYGQLNYIPVENVWHQNRNPLNYTTLNQFLTSDSTDLDALVESFLACWEGVPGDALELRKGWAHKYYDFIYKNASKPPATWKASGGNYYQDPLGDDAYNNVMCVYWWAGGVEPEQPTKKKKGMPLWMFLKKQY